MRTLARSSTKNRRAKAREHTVRRNVTNWCERLASSKRRKNELHTQRGEQTAYWIVLLWATASYSVVIGNGMQSLNERHTSYLRARYAIVWLQPKFCRVLLGTAASWNTPHSAAIRSNIHVRKGVTEAFASVTPLRILLRIARTQTYAIKPNKAQWNVLTTYVIRRLAYRPALVAR